MQLIYHTALTTIFLLVVFTFFLSPFHIRYNKIEENEDTN